MTRTDKHGNSLDPVETHCGECGARAEAVTGEKRHPHRPDLAGKRMYCCTACDAYVGCHDNTWQPLGFPALDHTRLMRRKAHGHFDPIWKAIQAAEKRLPHDHPRRRTAPRARAYEWLAKEMRMPLDRCHIGMMNGEEARRVVDICGPHLQKLGLRPERQN